MNLLITGATGFVGSHIARALEAAGHRVRAAVRRPARLAAISPTFDAYPIDFNSALRPEDWAKALQGIDVVVNAVGILRESRSQPFENLHHRAPAALFDAAVAAGVKRIVQISALGADASARTPYQRSKKAADDHLSGLPIASAIVQPSVVFGPGSGSAKMFSFIARLPLIPLPGHGQQALQPIFIEDLSDAVVELVDIADMPTGRLPFVGPEAVSLREFYVQLRQALGIKSPARFVPVPMPLIEASAWVGSHLPGVLLDQDTLTMLNQGSVGDSSVVTALLRRPPRPIRAFYAQRPASHRS